jgi:hypothetical protein
MIETKNKVDPIKDILSWSDRIDEIIQSINKTLKENK